MAEPVQTKSTLGGPPGRARVSLAVRGPDLDPQEIARLLQCTADSSHRRGDTRPNGPPFRDGVWEITESSDDEANVGALIERLFDRIVADAHWPEHAARYQVTLGVYILLTSENQDFVLPARLLAQAVALGAELWCDLYTDLPE